MKSSITAPAYTGGSPTGGTLNELHRYENGDLSYSITGFSIPADTFHDFLIADDIQGFMAYIFAGNDFLSGSEQIDLLIGYDGDDVIFGNGGEDVLRGAGGNDSMYGGAGGDIIFEIDEIDSGNDFIDGGADSDILSGGDGNDTVYGGAGSDFVGGGAGNDFLDAGGEPGDNAVGGAGDDSLYGGEYLDGEEGNDLLDGTTEIEGGIGYAWLEGGTGNDTYLVDSNDEVIVEDQAGKLGGTDKVYSTASDFVLTDNVEQLYLTGAADINGTGNSLNNIIVGNSGDNDIDGGTGIDSMTGGDGDDVFVVDNSKDVVSEGAGKNSGMDTVHSSAASYTLANNVEQLVMAGDDDVNGTGNSLNNYIQGNDGANILNGGGGKDTILALDGNDGIDGGLGDDVIVGHGGNDTINLSQGNDRVLYSSLLDGHDVLNSFDGNAAGGQDVFDLDLLFDSADVATADRADFISIVDNGASVDVGINFLGGVLVIATLNTGSAVTVGADVDLGTL